MGGTIREIEVVDCWKYAGNKPPIPTLKIKIIGVGKEREITFNIDTGYPGEILLSTKLYEDLNLFLAELPEENFGVYRTASGLIEVKRSEAIIEILNIGFRTDVIIETPRYYIFDRNLVGRSLINKLILLIDGKNNETCIIRY